MFDIKWEFVKVDGTLKAIIEYRNELFTKDEIVRYKDYFIDTLKNIIR
ncbi:hypothetical protein RU87_GL001289 [Lactococcus plantarum]|uniref:Uncharacterized protein n=1 Tax=Pseudolactococcus plantarum TaxID=1365 RepID=A0A2A5S143_9LACT|nr:hypothetical protein RU87_GL001289 [Lactococcus plantarum]HCN74966.1 hypothetical protein [Lactococcus sp.]